MRTEVKLSPPYCDSFHYHLSCQLESCRSVSQPVTSTLQERQLKAGLNFSLRHDAPQTCELASIHISLHTDPRLSRLHGGHSDVSSQVLPDRMLVRGAAENHGVGRCIYTYITSPFSSPHSPQH